jgi:7-cyano-7-deazaguanine reductase
MQDSESKTYMDNLSLLGNSKIDYPTNPDEAVLEAIPNLSPENDYVVNLDCQEFTCACPKTGQPDFAQIDITYIPGKHLVESKALKLYLFSYRNHGIFHEFVTNKIAKDLVKAIKPKYIKVVGNFSPRGGIAIKPIVELGDLELGKKYVR